MMNKYFLTALSAAVLSTGVYAQEGHIPALGGAPTGAYGSSTVETKLNVNIQDHTEAVHFIRDNNDPWVVTKAYVIKNADPFILRGVLKTIVAGTLTDNPVAIESVLYVDGSAVLLISAEEYRFKNAANGMSMDELVASLDKKGLPNSSGTVDRAYFPKYNRAEVLLRMVEESGIGWSGARSSAKAFSYDKNGLHCNKDLLFVAGVDYDLNAIIMSSPGFDTVEFLKFMEKVDTPTGEIKLSYKLLEVYAENDQKLGLDFQAWKNNDGVDLFSAGGRYGTNWGASGLTPQSGYRYTEYFHFNPKWNTKYLDFLTTCGKAKIVSSGSMVVANGASANLTFTEDFFTVVGDYYKKNVTSPATPSTMVITYDEETGKYIVETTKGSDASTGTAKYTVADNLPSGDAGGHYAKDLENVVQEAKNMLIREGRTQETEASTGNVFSLNVNAGVSGKASTLDVNMVSSSLIGWDGQGKARLSNATYSTTVQISNEKKEFVIGGLTKTSVVRSVTGLPWLKDLPVLGWIFSTETDTVKKSQFVLVASAEVITPATTLTEDEKAEFKKISEKLDKAEKKPQSTLGFQQMYIDEDK